MNSPAGLYSQNGLSQVVLAWRYLSNLFARIFLVAQSSPIPYNNHITHRNNSGASQ
jgi:hypothetical protein